MKISKSKAEKRRERRTRTLAKYIIGTDAAVDAISDAISGGLPILQSPISNHMEPTEIHMNNMNNMNNTTTETTNSSTNSVNHLNGVQVKWDNNSIPKELQKYFNQRYSLFHKFDDCWIDYEGWYSVTPEVIAAHTSNRLKNCNVVDAFCGVGGNAIQFALNGSKVIAIDLDETRLSCARHNAIVYGVQDLITFIHGDYLNLASSIHTYPGFEDKSRVAVFLSPPWGGPEYLDKEVYRLGDLPVDSKVLHLTSKSVSDNICYYMPRNTSEGDMIELADGGKVELEKTFLQDRFKVLQVYYGDLAGNNLE